MINLKVHKLKSLCTQIWPQYKLDNQNHWPEYGTFHFNILSDLTNFLNAIANHQKSPIVKPSGTLEAVLLSARTVLPIKFSSALSPPPLQKNPNLKPLKGPLNPQPPVSMQQVSLLPTALGPHPLALPPPKQEAVAPKPQKRYPPTPPPSARTSER